MTFATLQDFFTNYRIQNGKQPNETVLNKGLMRLKRETRELKSLSDISLFNTLASWNAATYYEADEYVSYDSGSGPRIYKSLVYQNVNVPPTGNVYSETNWLEIPYANVSNTILATSFGAFASSSTTSASVTSASTSVTLAIAQDFADGQYIAIYHAGPGPYEVGTTTTLAPPTNLTITPTGTAGTTTYTYYVSAIDDLGGITAVVQASTTTGNATLDGTNYNTVSVTASTGARGYAWYRNGTLIAVTPDASINDTGLTFSAIGVQAETIPLAPPSSSLGQTLITQIISGGGTTTLTVGTAPSVTIASAVVHHENSQAINNAISYASSLIPSGDTHSRVRVRIPVGEYPCSLPITVPAGVELDTQGTLYNELADSFDTVVNVSPYGHIGLLQIWNNNLSGVTLGTASTYSNTEVGKIRLWNTGNTASSSGSLQQRGVVIQGYDFDIGSLEVDGGNVGIDINGASDVRVSRLISVLAATSLRITSGSEQIFLPVCQLDTPYYMALQVDSSDGIRAAGRIFINNQNLTSGLSSGYAASLGQYSSGNPVHDLNLDFEINNTGGTGVYLGYIEDSPNLNFNINNGTLGTGNSTPVLNGLDYSANVSPSIGITGSINVTGTVITGTPVGSFRAQVGGVSAYTVATLPANMPQGTRFYVTDATTPTFLGTLTGGGSVVCPAFYDGTNWIAA